MTKRRIYVVDDEEPIRRSTRLMLAVQGYEVAAFESGLALLDAFDGLAAGAILLDMRMPGMDGLEVQRALNARAAPHPVIVMTGHGDLSVALAALQAGATAFLEKPFARATLDEALAAAFRKLEDPAGYAAERQRAQAAIAALPETEQRLLSGLVGGLSTEKMASALGTSTQLVEARRARLFAELGVDNMTDALALAFSAGLGSNLAD
jgi:two-component system response regulator FixJ